MLFKKLTIFLLGISCLALFLGCSEKKETVEANSDSAFMLDLAKGLEARWDYVQETNAASTKENYLEGLQKELTQIKKYEKASFEDEQLHQLALAYINELSAGLALVSQFDSSDFEEKWMKHHEKRAERLYSINHFQAIKVQEKYQAALGELIKAGKNTQLKEEIYQKVESLLVSSQLAFNEEKSSETTVHYETTLKNTTGYTIETLRVIAKLTDAEGHMVSENQIDLANWKEGEERLIEISADKEFSNTELQIETLVVE